MQKQVINCVVAPDKVGGYTKRIVIGNISVKDVERIVAEKKYV